MEKAIKIVTIGGGGSYTPKLMEGFIKRYDEKYLPQFKEKIIELKARGVASKDYVVVDLVKNGH